MTIDHSYPYQHEWHLARHVEEFWHGEFYMVIAVWVCQCNAMKRHVFRKPKLLVYDPEDIQNHEGEMDDIELVDDIP